MEEFSYLMVVYRRSFVHEICCPQDSGCSHLASGKPGGNLYFVEYKTCNQLGITLCSRSVVGLEHRKDK